MKKYKLIFFLIFFFGICLFSKHDYTDLSVVKTIILNIRLPELITAFSAGVGLSLSGLVMQIIFKNPLAGPFVLGVNSGATLFLGIFLLLFPYSASLYFGMIPSFLGALIVMGIILYFLKNNPNHYILLIVGLLVSFLCSGILSIIQQYLSSENLREYIYWGLGSFSTTDIVQSLILFASVICFLLYIFNCSSELNLYQLGQVQAISYGLDVERVQKKMILSVGLLVSMITSFCGPIVFIGVIVPHFARIIFNTNSTSKLIQGSVIISGILTTSIIYIQIVLEQNIPINALLSLMAVPSLIYLLIGKKRSFA
ncbi:MAG: iron ABC transporter permease [Halobacteriovoraceae bacterium]|nr:iron ABC transporter permease [Halobacteriovoraceae bacterium]